MRLTTSRVAVVVFSRFFSSNESVLKFTTLLGVLEII